VGRYRIQHIHNTLALVHICTKLVLSGRFRGHRPLQLVVCMSQTLKKDGIEPLLSEDIACMYTCTCPPHMYNTLALVHICTKLVLAGRFRGHRPLQLVVCMSQTLKKDVIEPLLSEDIACLHSTCPPHMYNTYLSQSLCLCAHIHFKIQFRDTTQAHLCEGGPMKLDCHVYSHVLVYFHLASSAYAISYRALRPFQPTLNAAAF
jgi:hypothetical protein